MALKLMYITNNPEVARIAVDAGVDRIFIDMEFIGKDKRQKGLDTVQNHHTISDIKNIKKNITDAEILVRINPIHDRINGYMDSKEEINEAINAGADILMLPYFTTPEEVKTFIGYVNGRVKTIPLLESARALDRIDEILQIEGIDQIYIGLNDLSLDLGKKFMFELLTDGTVERLCQKFKNKNLEFGFGGLASLSGGAVSGKLILKEHYRLGSSSVILSRSFCNANKITNLDQVEKIFNSGIADIRNYEVTCLNAKDYEENKQAVQNAVKRIVENLS